jgi:hypothetical protein
VEQADRSPTETPSARSVADPGQGSFARFPTSTDEDIQAASHLLLNGCKSLHSLEIRIKTPVQHDLNLNMKGVSIAFQHLCEHLLMISAHIF